MYVDVQSSKETGCMFYWSGDQLWEEASGRGKLCIVFIDLCTKLVKWSSISTFDASEKYLSLNSLLNLPNKLGLSSKLLLIATIFWQALPMVA